MEKISSENEMCCICVESSTKGYAIAPIDGLFPRFPDDGDLNKTHPCCCDTSAAAAAKNEIDRIISELSAWEKEQLLLMILRAGIPSKTPFDNSK